MRSVVVPTLRNSPSHFGRYLGKVFLCFYDRFNSLSLETRMKYLSIPFSRKHLH